MTAIGSRRILLVEDNPMDLDLALRAFKRSRLSNPIDVARDGEEALEWLTRLEGGEPRPIVILLDLNLPRVSGLDVLRAFKRHAVLRTIPVIVLTTSADGQDVKQAYEAGANSYIVKPVDFDKFVDVAAQVELYWTVANTVSE